MFCQLPPESYPDGRGGSTGYPARQTDQLVRAIALALHNYHDSYTKFPPGYAFNR
jgi:hypothetical protein